MIEWPGTYSEICAPAEVDVSEIQLPPRFEKAVSQRRLQAAAARLCARRALMRAGCPDAAAPLPDLAVDHPYPVWPAGWSGSLSHTVDLAWAMVVPSPSEIGIDVEPVMPLGRALKLLPKILTPSDQQLLTSGGFAPWSPEEAITLIFSIKESLFKALYPRYKNYFGFQDAEVQSIGIRDGALKIQHLPTHRIFEGKFSKTSKHLFSAVLIPSCRSDR